MSNLVLSARAEIPRSNSPGSNSPQAVVPRCCMEAEANWRSQATVIHVHFMQNNHLKLTAGKNSFHQQIKLSALCFLHMHTDTNYVHAHSQCNFCQFLPRTALQFTNISIFQSKKSFVFYTGLLPL